MRSDLTCSGVKSSARIPRSCGPCGPREHGLQADPRGQRQHLLRTRRGRQVVRDDLLDQAGDAQQVLGERAGIGHTLGRRAFCIATPALGAEAGEVDMAGLNRPNNRGASPAACRGACWPRRSPCAEVPSLTREARSAGCIGRPATGRQFRRRARTRAPSPWRLYRSGCARPSLRSPVRCDRGRLPPGVRWDPAGALVKRT